MHHRVGSSPVEPELPPRGTVRRVDGRVARRVRFCVAAELRIAECGAAAQRPEQDQRTPHVSRVTDGGGSIRGFAAGVDCARTLGAPGNSVARRHCGRGRGQWVTVRSLAAAGVALCMLACGETSSTAPAAAGTAPDRDVYLHVEHMIGLLYRSQGGHLASPNTVAPKQLPELFTLDGEAYAPTTPEAFEPHRMVWKFGVQDGYNVRSGPVWIDHGPKTLPRLLVSPAATPEEIKLRTPAHDEGAGALPDALREQAIDDACKWGGTAEAVQGVGAYYVVRTMCKARDEPKVLEGTVFLGMPNAAVYHASGGKPILARPGVGWAIRITHLLDLDGDGVDEALTVIKPGTSDSDHPRDVVLFEGSQRVRGGQDRPPDGGRGASRRRRSSSRRTLRCTSPPPSSATSPSTAAA